MNAHKSIVLQRTMRVPTELELFAEWIRILKGEYGLVDSKAGGLTAFSQVLVWEDPFHLYSERHVGRYRVRMYRGEAELPEGELPPSDGNPLKLYDLIDFRYWMDERFTTWCFTHDPMRAPLERIIALSPAMEIRHETTVSSLEEVAMLQERLMVRSRVNPVKFYEVV